MYFTNYEEKYKKYKNKYQKLKNKFNDTKVNLNSATEILNGCAKEILNGSAKEILNGGAKEILNSGAKEILNSGAKEILNGGAKEILNGGECVILPNPEDEDFNAENLLDLCPNERITIQNKCYNIRGLYKWIIKKKNNLLPSTQTNITFEEKQRLRQAYIALSALPVPLTPALYPYLTYSQLPIYVTLNKSHLQKNKYEEEIKNNYSDDDYASSIYKIPECFTEFIYRHLEEMRIRILKISGFGRRSNKDNMFLTVSDPGTGRYYIDIWKVTPGQYFGIENVFNLYIGNRNVVRRGEYRIFASNIIIEFAHRNNDHNIDYPDLDFNLALWLGIKITIKSFVYDYDTDCDTFSFDLKYRHKQICYNRLKFHNYYSKNIQKRWRRSYGWNV
jgi:hypothetical protein